MGTKVCNVLNPDIPYQGLSLDVNNSEYLNYERPKSSNIKNMDFFVWILSSPLKSHDLSNLPKSKQCYR